MGVSDLHGERTTAAVGMGMGMRIPSALRPLLWGGHNLNTSNNSMDSSMSSADAMDVIPDEDMDGIQREDVDVNADVDVDVDADMSMDEDQHENDHPHYLNHDDIENDRRAFDRPNQSSSSSSSTSSSTSTSTSTSAASPLGTPVADDKISRLAAPLNHHTPVTRFLSRQTLGFIPKLSARPSPLADATLSTSNGDGGGPEALKSPLGSGFRLPSLSNTPPLSPHKWTGADERFPPFLGPPQRVASCGNLADKFAIMSTALASPHTGTGPIPSLKEALQRGAGELRSDSGASTASSAGSPPGYHTGMLTMRDICRPMAYQRSASCPSDPTVSSALLSAASEASARFPAAFTGAERFADEVPASPASSFSSSAPPFEDESEEDEARRSPPPPSVEPRPLSLLDITQNRLERSSSLDGRRLQRPPAESIDLYQWLDRKSLHSLTESAHAMQMLAGSAAAIPSGFEHPGTGTEHAEGRREKKLCAFPQCASNAVTRGLCISHGGGRRCQRKGCTRGAQSKGLCVAHGGGRICRAKGCSNIQRSMGLCIRHGGGRRCCVPGCHKGVVRQDLCTAHGGKRKCRVEDCNKHVKKKGLCRAHANVLGQASEGGSPA